MPLDYKQRNGISDEAWNTRPRAMYPATGRMGKVPEVVDVKLFLSSEAASNIHGASIPVDGGFSIQ